MKTDVNGRWGLWALGCILLLALGASASTLRDKPSPKRTGTIPEATATVTADVAMGKKGGEPSLGANAPTAVKAILEKVEKAQADVKDVRMDLRMEVKDNTSGQKQSTRGQVMMKAPGKVFVHYLKPAEQFLYIDGKEMQMYLPDQAMVYKQSTDKSQPTYIGVGKQLKRYSATSRVSIVKDSDEEVVLLFIPEGADAAFERMKVTVRKKDGWPSKVEMEAGSMKTVAEFLKPVFNQGIEDSVFKFTAPDGANVVEGRIF